MVWGVLSVNQARILMIDDTVSNNAGRGIQVAYGGFVFLSALSNTNTISDNGGQGIFATLTELCGCNLPTSPEMAETYSRAGWLGIADGTL